MPLNPEAFRKRLNRRYRAEKRMQCYGVAALLFAVGFLAFFFIDMIRKGYTAFVQGKVRVELVYNEKSAQTYGYRNAVAKEYQKIVSRGVLRVIPKLIRHNPELMNTSETKWVLTTAEVDQYLKGKPNKLSDEEKAQVDRMRAAGNVKLGFNTGLFTRGDSKLPEMAGIKAAVVGTIYVMIITMLVAVPIGVMTSIYLEEFAPDNRLTQTIEVNINNLAAIPSILFGLLGLAVVINFFGVPRSSALAGGITLGLMMLPIIIIATRAALRSVPDSIREGAYGVGASPWQVVQHHVLPLCLPGILTGAIISLAQAMGETAPLLIVGLMAYIPEAPSSVLEGATVLPAQVYTWASDSQRAYTERTAAGILILLAVLLSLNAVAIWLRHATERKW